METKMSELVQCGTRQQERYNARDQELQRVNEALKVADEQLKTANEEQQERLGVVQRSCGNTEAKAEALQVWHL